MPTVEIWSTTENAALDYVLHGFGDISHHDDPDDDKLSSESNDSIHQFSDGSYVVVGHTGNGYGDSFEVEEKPYLFNVYSGDSDHEVIYEGSDVTDDLNALEIGFPEWIDEEGMVQWVRAKYDEPDQQEPEPEPEPVDETAWFDEVGYFRKEPDNPVTQDDADYSVNTTDQFLNALQQVGDGDTIWVEGDAVINLSGHSGLGVGADNVTIASNRNIPQGRRGGAIVVNDHPGNVFKTSRDSLRITGLYIEGPIPDTFIEDYDSSKASAFGLFYGEDCEFDNNEFTGWPFAGLALGAKNYPVSHEVHHNDFHDNLMQGLGYGLELYNGFHTLHHNYFNRNRHDIAGFGRSENGYEAYHNVSGPDPFYHAFDMHGVSQNTGGDSLTAGGTIHVHDNLFMFTHSFTDHPQEAFKIRGVPDDHCTVEANYFKHEDEPVEPGQSGDAYMQSRVDEWRNFTARDNEFGTEYAVDPPEEARGQPYELPEYDQPDDPFTFSVSSTNRTPAMEYTFRVDGVVPGGESLENKDTIETNDGETVVTGTVGPRGTDHYTIEGTITGWEAIRADTGVDVPETDFEVRVNGEPSTLWSMLGWDEPEYDDQSAAALGGGEHYSRTVTEDEADYVAGGLESAQNALNEASSGEVVFIDGSAELYSPSKDERLHVPEGVTLASNRGVGGSKGAIVRTDAAYGWGGDGLITVSRGGRVTGLRVPGPHPDERWPEHNGDYEMSGIRATGANVEVDNCEVYGWAICVRAGEDCHIHHNHLHHANMQGLGYAIHAGSTEGGLFEYNRFEHWRHVVAGSGGGGYEACNNYIDGPCISHAFDQHPPGGTYADIHHNTSAVMEHDAKSKDPVFAAFRGDHTKNAEVYNNWVKGNTAMPLDAPNGWTDEFIIRAETIVETDVEWWDNHLGTSEPSSPDVGCPR